MSTTYNYVYNKNIQIKMQGNKKTPKIIADKTIFNAAIENDFDTIVRFCENNGNQTSLDDCGNTLLMTCLIGKYDIKLIEYLLERVDCNIPNMHNQNPFHYMTQCCRWNGNLPNYRNIIIHILALAGVDTNKTDKFGDTPLYCELQNNFCNPTIINLLNHGANINYIDPNGNNLLMRLIKEYLNKNVTRWLHYPDKVKILLENGADVYQLNNYKNKPQETPLMIAYAESILNFSRTIGGQSFAGNYFNYCNDILKRTNVNHIYENGETILMLVVYAIDFYSEEINKKILKDNEIFKDNELLKDNEWKLNSYIILFKDILKKKPNLDIKNSNNNNIVELVDIYELPILKAILLNV